MSVGYTLSTNLAKVSLLFLYLRICPDRKFHIMTKIMAAVFLLYAFIYVLICVLGCRPVAAAWDLAIMSSRQFQCVDRAKFFLAASIANVGMDVLILLLPIPIIMPLQMPWRQKISLLLLFATGGL